MTDGAVQLCRASTAHLSSRDSVAGNGGVHTVAREYDCICAGLHHRHYSRHLQDSSGGVLPGATITVTNPAPRRVQTTVSDDRGQYLFAGLFPGTYDLKVELSGVQDLRAESPSLSPSDNRGIDIRLDVGQQTETVTVTAQPK